MQPNGTIHISSQGGTGLSFNAIDECEFKCSLYIQGYRQRVKQHYLWYGGVMHRHMIDLRYQDSPPGDLPDLASAAVRQVIATGKSEYIKPDGEVQVDEAGMPDDDMKRAYPDIAHNGIEAWEEVGYTRRQVLDFERTLRPQVPVNPDTGKIDPEVADLDIAVVGRKDLTVETDLGIGIIDLKTPATASKFIPMDTRKQLGTYAYLDCLEHDGVNRVHYVGVRQITKQKTTETIMRHAQIELAMKPMAMRMIYRIIVEASKKIRGCFDKNDWPQRFTQCEGKFSPCPFYHLCWYEDNKKQFGKDAAQELVDTTVIEP